MYSIPIGVLCALLGNTIISASFTLLKLAHNKHRDEGVSAYKQKTWLLGMLFMAPGELLNLVGFGFAPTLLISPLGSSGLVTSAIFAKMFLKETLLRIGYVGIFITSCGGVAIALSMPETEAASPFLVMQQNISSPEFTAYVAIIVSIAMILAPSSRLLPLTAVLAIYGALCSLACRAVATGVEYIGVTYIYILCVVIALVFIILQCVTFQRALSSHPLTMIIPLHFSMQQTVLTVGSALLYDGTRYINVALFVVGILCSIVGCTCICRGRSENNNKNFITELAEIIIDFKEDETTQTHLNPLPKVY